MAGLQRSTIATIAILGVPTVAVLAFTLWDRSNAPPSVPSAAPVATPSPAVAPRPRPRRPRRSRARAPRRHRRAVAVARAPGAGGRQRRAHHPAGLGGGRRGAGPARSSSSRTRPARTRRCRTGRSTPSGRPSTSCRSRSAASRPRRSTRARSCRSTGRAAATPASPRKEVQKVEDVVGRKSAVLMFSPDHTVLEFMLTNSRLTPDEVAQVRKDTSFSMDDFTYARMLFGKRQDRRRLPVGAGRHAGARQPAGRAPPVLDGGRDRAGRRHAGRAARVPGPATPSWR